MINENFPIHYGWLIPFQNDHDFIYERFNLKQDYQPSNNELNYLNEHNDGC